MKRIVLVSVLVGLGAAPAFAEKWTVIEGPKGETQSVWDVSRQGETYAGKGVSQTRGAAAATYDVTVAISGGKVTASRMRSSDQRSCNYIGEVKNATEIAGTAICGGVSGVWRVTRKD